MNELITIEQETQRFELDQRKASALITGNILPEHFKTVGDILILGEMSRVLNIPVVMLAQQVFMVKGRPSMSGQLIIALLNSSDKTAGIMRWETRKEPWGIRAYNDVNGKTLYSDWIDDELILKNGWGSKNQNWITNKNLLARYRSATYWGRLYAPELLLGFTSEGETEDNPTTADIVDEAKQMPKPKRKRRTKQEIEAENKVEETERAEDTEIIPKSEPEAEETIAKPKVEATKSVSALVVAQYPLLLRLGMKRSRMMEYVNLKSLDVDNINQFVGMGEEWIKTDIQNFLGENNAD